VILLIAGGGDLHPCFGARKPRRPGGRQGSAGKRIWRRRRECLFRPSSERWRPKMCPSSWTDWGRFQAFNTVTVRCRVEGTLEKIHFREGQDVRAGDLLAQTRCGPLSNPWCCKPRAGKPRMKPSLKNARIELKRNATLLANKIVSQGSVRRRRGAGTPIGSRRQSRRGGGGKALRVQLAYTTIQAPIDGRTGIRLVDEGNVIRSGDSKWNRRVDATFGPFRSCSLCRSRPCIKFKRGRHRAR